MNAPAGLRCAGYYTPAAGHPLSRRASAWLGRDAFAGEPLDRPLLQGITAGEAETLTADPAGYGFHATIRAPFEPSATVEEVCACMDAFTAPRRPFDIRLKVADLKGFLALVLAEPSPGMQALHEDMMAVLESVRAPLSAHDRARRAKGEADPDHDARLDRWGYPHVFGHFTFHMTLTGRIRDAARREAVRSALAEHFADLTALPLRVDGAAVFLQPDRASPFTVRRWSPFAA